MSTTPEPGLTALEDRVCRIAKLADEMKGQDIVALDLRGISDFADAFVIITATSSTHLKAIVHRLHSDLANEGIKPFTRPESGSDRWGVIDYSDIVVHVFEDVTRDYYNLEQLWGDAPEIDLTPAGIDPRRIGQTA